MAVWRPLDGLVKTRMGVLRPLLTTISMEKTAMLWLGEELR